MTMIIDNHDNDDHDINNCDNNDYDACKENHHKGMKQYFIEEKTQVDTILFFGVYQHPPTP